MAGRGCPFRCTFCAQVAGKYVMRSPERVAEELAQIDSKDVIFYDDTLTASPSWLTRLHDCIKAAGINKCFRCSTRADKITDRVAEMLASMGFQEVCIGVESGSQKILDVLNKRTTPAQNADAIRILKRHGMSVKAFIMVGSPGESDETMGETYDWITENQPDKIGLYIFRPLPGCDIYEHPERYDIKFEKYDFPGMFYGGHREEMEAHVSTSALSRNAITTWYRTFLTTFST